MAVTYDEFGNVIEPTPPPPTPEPQVAIDPATDPFEESRLAAEAAAAQEGPTEQPVIDANVDAGIEDALAHQNQDATTSPTEQDVLDAMSDPSFGKAGTGEKVNPDATPASKPTLPVKSDFKAAKDWRVRLSLAPNADYLYKGADAGILKPLEATNGVIFPYTPTITMNYSASYDPVDLTHSNYKIQQYRNSSVGDLTITAEFTAQDTQEANYLLAVIHFFRSVTKMFYGQDKTPPNGVPPPLCYISGYGAYQFDNHPLVVTNFSYSLPNDVDYIRAGENVGGRNLQTYAGTKKPVDNLSKITSFVKSQWDRLTSSGAPKGGIPAQPEWTVKPAVDATYVPTKMTITIICAPIVSRHDVSNRFSLNKYGSGELLRGSKNNSGGIW